MKPPGPYSIPARFRPRSSAQTAQHRPRAALRSLPEARGAGPALAEEPRLRSDLPVPVPPGRSEPGRTARLGSTWTAPIGCRLRPPRSYWLPAAAAALPLAAARQLRQHRALPAPAAPRPRLRRTPRVPPGPPGLPPAAGHTARSGHTPAPRALRQPRQRPPRRTL